MMLLVQHISVAVAVRSEYLGCTAEVCKQRYGVVYRADCLQCWYIVSTGSLIEGVLRCIEGLLW